MAYSPAKVARHGIMTGKQMGRIERADGVGEFRNDVDCRK